MNVFIGFEPRQPVAYSVCAASVAARSSVPVSVTALRLGQLPLTRRGLTEFTYSRFLVPYLSKFRGISLFLDSDILVRSDIVELLAYTVGYSDVPVFMVPREGALKFESPSVMLFNNVLCQNLTPAFVEDRANKMFDMNWASGIGALPKEWNHLVGYDLPNPNAKIVHFTKGIPVWGQTWDCEFAEEWRVQFRDAASTCPYQELMGRSVHVQRT